MNVNNLRAALKNERQAEQLREDMGASKTKLTGELKVNGAGETQVQVTFPVKFTEKPFLSFGAELLEREPILPGFLPTISVVVLGWITEERPPTSRLYVGAKLAVVTGGAAYQKMSVHWTVEAMALGNPV